MSDLRRDLFEWWDSLGPNDEVVSGPLVQLIRQHQADAWEHGRTAGLIRGQQDSFITIDEDHGNPYAPVRSSSESED